MKLKFLLLLVIFTMIVSLISARSFSKNNDQVKNLSKKTNLVQNSKDNKSILKRDKNDDDEDDGDDDDDDDDDHDDDKDKGAVSPQVHNTTKASSKNKGTVKKPKNHKTSKKEKDSAKISKPKSSSSDSSESSANKSNKSNTTVEGSSNLQPNTSTSNETSSKKKEPIVVEINKINQVESNSTDSKSYTHSNQSSVINHHIHHSNLSNINASDAEVDKIYHHHHHEHKNSAVNFTEAELDEHHHHHLNETENGSLNYEIHNHHKNDESSKNLTDYEIHHKFHHHHAEDSIENNVSEKELDEHHHHHSDHLSQNMTSLVLKKTSQKADSSNSHHKNCSCSRHQKQDESKVLLNYTDTVDLSNANFSTILAESILKSIKEGVDLTTLNGTINIIVAIVGSGGSLNLNVPEPVIRPNEESSTVKVSTVEQQVTNSDSQSISTNSTLDINEVKESTTIVSSTTNNSEQEKISSTQSTDASETTVSSESIKIDE